MAKGNGEKVSIAVIKTDLRWLRAEVKEMSDNVKSIQTFINMQNDRIKTLEDYKENQEENFSRSISKWGIFISAVSIIVSTVVSFLFRR